MSISLVKQPPATPSFGLLKKPPRNNPLNIGFDLPSGGLVPIGDTGLWITPNEPADPQDCERYEGSAFCTPFFFTLAPFTLEPAIAIDECNIGVRVDGSFGFIRVPPVSLVYRYPGDACKPPLPIVPPTGSGESVPFPYNSCDENVRSLIVIPPVNRMDLYEATGEAGYLYETSSTTNTISSIEYPYEGDIGVYTASNGIVVRPFSAKINITRTSSYSMNEAYKSVFHTPDHPSSNTETFNYYYMMRDTNDTAIEDQSKTLILQKSITEAREQLKDLKNDFSVEPLIGNNNEVVGYYLQETFYKILIKCGKEDISKLPPPPPEYNPPERLCCMSCCPSHGEPDNSLLNLLIKKVDKLSSVVGVDEYPIKLPASLISKDEGFFGNLIPNNDVDINSLTTFAAWYIERFDEIMGQWEIPIEIKDSDPSQPGEQPVGIKLPNIAECMAELFTLSFQTNINTETLLNMCMRTLGETGADKQQNFVTYKLLQSLTDWVGYKQKDVKVKMPLMFSLSKTRYDQILQESEVEVSVPEFDDKFGLEADLMRFREAASILQANHKVKINPNGDIKAQILAYLLKTFSGVNKINGEEQEQDFEDFLEEVETGFINTPGVSNNTEPYGKPFNERPKIRDLTAFSTDNPTP